MPAQPSQKFYVDLDLMLNQAVNMVLHRGNPPVILTASGQVGFNTGTDRPAYRKSTGAIHDFSSIDAVETLLFKTLESPVVNISLTGSAIVTYAGGGMGSSLGACSDSKVPSEKAVFAAISNGLAANDAMIYKGAIDCSANPDYPSGDTGHTYKVSVGGKIGGVSGPTVEAGDTLICTLDGSPSGNHATVGGNWNIIQYNIDILPASRGGTGSSLAPWPGDLLIGNSTGSFDLLGNPEDTGMVLTINAQGMPDWLEPPSQYYAWNLLTGDLGSPVQITSGETVNYEAISGGGINVSYLSGMNHNVRFRLENIESNAILARSAATAGVPTSFQVSSAGVVGRLATGNILNIPFGTAANTVAWGDHTHSQLHNQVHALVGPDHTVSGLIAGQVVIATGATTFAWSVITLPGTCAQGDLLFASATNAWATLPKSSTQGHFLKNTGVNNNPVWGAITFADLPVGIPRYYVASYETGGAGTTTLTIPANTHGCGLKPMVQFYETNGTIDYRAASAQILIDQATGDITVNTATAIKGKVIIIGS